MAIEHMNGDFEIGNFEEMKEKFFDMVDMCVPVRALHVGSFDELQKRSKEKSIKQRLDDLEAKLKETEIVRSSFLHLPTKDDVDKFSTTP